MLKRGQLQSRLLARLTTGGVARVLARIHPPCNGLQHPGARIAPPIGAHAELLDQQHPVAHRIIGQDQRGIGGHKDLALHDRAETAVKSRMTQRHAAGQEKPLMAVLRGDQLDLIGPPVAADLGRNAPGGSQPRLGPRPDHPAPLIQHRRR